MKKRISTKQQCQICKRKRDRKFFTESELRGKTGRCRYCQKGRRIYRRHTEPKFLIRHKYHSMVSTCKRRERPVPKFTADELIAWVFDGEKNQALFEVLFKNWQKNGFRKDDSPSFDRQNPIKGYELNNLKLMPWEMNLKKLWNYDFKVHAEKKQGDFFGRAPYLHEEEIDET